MEGWEEEKKNGGPHPFPPPITSKFPRGAALPSSSAVRPAWCGWRGDLHKRRLRYPRRSPLSPTRRRPASSAFVRPRLMCVAREAKFPAIDPSSLICVGCLQRFPPIDAHCIWRSLIRGPFIVRRDSDGRQKGKPKL